MELCEFSQILLIECKTNTSEYIIEKAHSSRPSPIIWREILESDGMCAKILTRQYENWAVAI